MSTIYASGLCSCVGASGGAEEEFSADDALTKLYKRGKQFYVWATPSLRCAISARYGEAHGERGEAHTHAHRERETIKRET